MTATEHHHQHHRIVWIDRNARDAEAWGVPIEKVRHVHRWQCGCSCGKWVGVPRKTRKRARDDWKGHESDRIASRRPIHPRAHYQGVPRKLTAVADLPEALR